MAAPAAGQLISLGGALALFFHISHSYDFAYLSRMYFLSQIEPRILRLFYLAATDPQSMGHRVLQWFVISSRVLSDDLDWNWHMNNSRYLRHADFVRTKALIATGMWPAIVAMGSSLVVTAVAQKFRREMPKGHEYQIWCRLVGWEKRHLYFEHIFVLRKRISDSRHHEAEEINQRVRHRVILDASKDKARQALDISASEFRSEDYTVASIVVVRTTMTRNKQGEIVTIEETLKQSCFLNVLPKTLPPPREVQDLTNDVEAISHRFVKPALRGLKSKL
jgi:acyl-CoA thioesterase FadM